MTTQTREVQIAFWNFWK